MTLNRVLRNAGIAAQAAPPTMPATHIAGSTQNPPERCQVASATAVPASPPRMYCPSAPMFHTPARNPIESPTAIMISGAALTPRSCHPPTSIRGSTKISLAASIPS